MYLICLHFLSPLSLLFEYYIWDNGFKNRPSKICGRQPLQKIYFVHSGVLCLILSFVLSLCVPLLLDTL